MLGRASSSAGEATDKNIGYTLHLTGLPVYSQTGRAGRNAAESRLGAIVPQGIVKKAIPFDNGTKIRGMLFDAEMVPDFQR